MLYERPQPTVKFSKQQRQALLRDYYQHYRRIASEEPSLLNKKLPRKALEELLDGVGSLLLDQAKKFAERPGPIREFLDQNPLPEPIRLLLPDSFHIFCLALNTLKQWVAAEQLATDRYILGGRSREECLAASGFCVVTGRALTPQDIDLHHPVRDGRPPIPLSKEGHARVEGQVSGREDGSQGGKLLQIKRETGRSWVHLRRGCLDLLGSSVQHSTPNVGASSRSFARKASKETGMTYEQLLQWLDQNKH